jgi:hypothetical protein
MIEPDILFNIAVRQKFLGFFSATDIQNSAGEILSHCRNQHRGCLPDDHIGRIA